MLLLSTPPYDIPVRLSPRQFFPAQKPCCPPKALRPSHLRSPSVTSVTSVRCFPRVRSFPPRSHAVHQKRCTVAPQIPLCDLRDLCAMLSPKRVFPRPEAMLSTKSIAPSHLRSPSVTSVTSVRCFPRVRSFPPRSHAVHQKRCTVAPQIPLCDLRDLCAMLSPKRVFPAQKPCCPPKALHRRTSDPPSVTSVTSVRCFPRSRSFPPRSHAVHQKPSNLHPPVFKFETSKISSHVRSRSPVFYRDFFGRNPERGRCEWRFPEEAGQRNRQRFLLCLFL